jgi:hypothetical protein
LAILYQGALAFFWFLNGMDDRQSTASIRIAEALYDAGAVLSNPRAFKPEEIRTLRDQITSNLERAWEITGRSEDKLTGMMVQISQVVAKEFKAED